MSSRRPGGGPSSSSASSSAKTVIIRPRNIEKTLITTRPDLDKTIITRRPTAAKTVILPRAAAADKTQIIRIAQQSVAKVPALAKTAAPRPVVACPAAKEGFFSKAASGLLGKLTNAAKELFYENFGEKFSDGIRIKGNKLYRSKVKKSLGQLQQTKSGKQIISALNKQGRAGKGVTIVPTKPGNNHCRPHNMQDTFPKQAKFDPKTGRVNVTQPGKGSKSEVGFNPDYEPKYNTGPNKGKPCRPASIGLGHELIHARNMGDGRNLMQFKDKTDTGMGSKGSNHEEAQTIGRGAYKNDSPTDNSLRSEMGYKQRTSHSSVCP